MEGFSGASSRYLGNRITRRQAIKAGSLAAMGLVFSRPIIETFGPKPAFASYVKAGQPSIEWLNDDITVTVPTGASSVSFTAVLCDVSTGPAVPFSAGISFLSEKADRGDQFDETDPDANLSFPPTMDFTVDQECKDVDFTVTFTGGFDGTNDVKLEFEANATGSSTSAMPKLTVTLTP